MATQESARNGGSAGRNNLHYKGYVGKVAFDEEEKILHGRVINLRDTITFEGTSVDELVSAFRESVDDYLAFCAQRGEEPEKPFSGKFVVRIDPELHRSITLEAQKRDLSLNQWVERTLESAAGETSQQNNR